jgi:hypothetical protein
LSDYQSLIEKFFEENKSQKEYFEEILILREKIFEISKEIEQMKQDQLKIFRSRFDSFKIISNKQSVKYDLIYAALFGNSIIL